MLCDFFVLFLISCLLINEQNEKSQIMTSNVWINLVCFFFLFSLFTLCVCTIDFHYCIISNSDGPIINSHGIQQIMVVSLYYSFLRIKFGNRMSYYSISMVFFCKFQMFAFFFKPNYIYSF